PIVGFQGGDLSSALAVDALNSMWNGPTQYLAAFTVADSNEEIAAVGITVDGISDELGNAQVLSLWNAQFDLDTRNPLLTSLDVTPTTLGLLDVGSAALTIDLHFDEALDTSLTPDLSYPNDDPLIASLTTNVLNTHWLNDSSFRKTYDLLDANEELYTINALLLGCADRAGNQPTQTSFPDLFAIDTHRASVQAAQPSTTMVMDDHVGTGGFHIDVTFSEMMDAAFAPLIQLTGATGSGVQYTGVQSSWTDAYTYRAVFNVTDLGAEIAAIGLNVQFARDRASNVQEPFAIADLFAVDTRNPETFATTSNTYVVTNADAGPGGFIILTLFDEPVDGSLTPVVAFNALSPVDGALTLDPVASSWLNASAYRWVYDVSNVVATIAPIGIAITGATDEAGNAMVANTVDDYFSIDLQLGIEGAATASGIHLFPNPVAPGTAVTLLLPSQLEGTVLEVYDVHGALVFAERHAVLSAGAHSIPLNDATPGLYLLRLNATDRSLEMKFVVE
ncbi:MAG TPA: T9SS type A sorting domain-containing protein, partial [Flavobacteriales bacterium]|nr:T9SS type A sorting domain-containing protein [Flavobacteriales bacterium]